MSVARGVRLPRDLDPTDFPVLLAAALVVTLPAVLAFGLVQRRFLSDVTGVHVSPSGHRER